MVAPKNFAWSFVDVAVFDKNRVYLAAGHDASLNKNIPVSCVLRWIDSWVSKAFGVVAVSICIVTHPQRTLLVVGHDGSVVRWGSTDFSEEHIDSGSEGPQSYGNIREVSAIGKHAYAVGMGRMVYRCESDANWVRADKGVRAKLTDESGSGFNSIAGFDEDEIYAVGWNGEIWGCTKGRWNKLKSPTELMLNKVICGGDGNVYVVGQRGVIIRGRAKQWEIIEQTETDDDFWGACWFQGKLYLSTSRGLFSLADTKLSPVKTGKRKNSRTDCYYRLSAVDDCIWSVGEKMLLRSSDGIVWDELPYS